MTEFNDGAALSLGSGGDNKVLFALVSLFASIAIECFLLIKKPKENTSCFPTTLSCYNQSEDQ